MTDATLEKLVSNDPVKRDKVEAGLRRIVDKLRFFPDISLLEQFPYGQQLIEEAVPLGGVETILDSLGRQTYFEDVTEPIPSPDQKLCGTEIALAGMEGRKRLELSTPGTRKTIGVLSAIPLINEVMMDQIGYEGQKVKTVVCCPTYIVPTWIGEAERLLRDPNIVVVTRKNRQRAIKKAARDNVDVVVLGYELSYRSSGIDFDDPETYAEMVLRHRQLVTTIFNHDDAYQLLSKVMRPDMFEKYRAKKRNLDSILRRIIVEEKNAEAASIARSLQVHAFPAEGKPYYAILDEVHNVIDPVSATALAVGDLFRKAKWGTLVTGTGIRNQLSNLAYIAYLAGRVQDAGDFPLVFRDNPRIIRSFLDLDANPRLTLKDVEPTLKEPKYKVLEYSLTSEEMDMYIEIANSEIFEGKDQYLLLGYLLTNPQKLLPEHFSEGDKEESLKIKMEHFFEVNPQFREYCETIVPSKLAVTKELVEKAKRERQKIVVACEYSSRLTDFLATELRSYGCVRVDQTVPAQMGEIELTPEQRKELETASLINGEEKFLSDLSLAARRKLGISHHQIYHKSDRELALLEFCTNPNITVLVASYGTLREGVDVQEASLLEEYEPTTVPSRFWQMLARLLRSGQDEEVTVYRPVARGEARFEQSKYDFRSWKDYLINLVFEGKDATPEELAAFIEDTTAEKSAQVGSVLRLNSRSIVTLMFDSLRGAGVDRFVAEMEAHDNALFLAKNYNYSWEYSYSANCARLIREVVHRLETKTDRRLEDIADLGCGPATVSRILHRKTINVDINRFQLEYGVDATEELGIDGSTHFLGSYTDLNQLTPLNSTPAKVFNPRNSYGEVASIKDGTIDLSVCSLALDFASEEERKSFFAENKRVLQYENNDFGQIMHQGHIILVSPTTKIEENCREQFLSDLESIGFEIDRELTGRYRSRTNVNVDTGEQDRNTFEAYVIVANKVDNKEIKYEDRPYFRMVNEYIVREGPRTQSDIESAARENKIKRLHCRDFYNVDANIILHAPSPSPEPRGVQPEVPLPSSPESLESFYDAVSNSTPDELTQLETALNKLIEHGSR